MLQGDTRGERERIEQSVLEEVALGHPVGGEHLAGYFRWRRSQVGMLQAILVLLGVCLISSVFTFATAVIFSLMMANVTGIGLLGAVTVAPLVEEFAKILLPLWIIDVRPWVFRWRWEIPLVCFAGGLGFAVIENVTYLHVYIDDPSPSIALWRWTVCTAMHVSGALISSIGVARYWTSRFAPSPPDHISSPMRTVGPFLAGAIVFHAAYNCLAIAFELAFQR